MTQHDAQNDIGTRKELVSYRLETARANLRVAKVLLEMKEYKDANNRAYYSIYHSITAVHELAGKSYKRHKDALGNFNKDYIKTGIFPNGLNKKIVKAEMIRHASDYDDFYIAKISEVEEIIATAEELLQLCEEFCQAELDGL